MRFIFVLLLFVSPKVFSQSCTEATITTGAQPYTCTTLTIGPGIHDFRVLSPPAPGVLEINVTGDVIVAPGAVLLLSGGEGFPANNTVTDGGVGGPGASDGGFASPSPEDAPEVPYDSGGNQGLSDTIHVCGSGGGGGGFFSTGNTGLSCLGNSGGTPGNPYLSLTVDFRGGFGGGAGGSASLAPVLGTGGGGGGAIWINAGGNVTLNGTIDVRGGKGGSAPVGSNAGGGGGGSGGAIRIQSTGGQVINNAIFLLDGGAGGNGDGAGSSGGSGSKGIYELSDLDNVISGSGTGAIGIPGESFKSSISCGAVKLKDETNLIFQVLMGFALVVLISRIRGQFRRSV